MINKMNNKKFIKNKFPVIHFSYDFIIKINLPYLPFHNPRVRGR